MKHKNERHYNMLEQENPEFIKWMDTEKELADEVNTKMNHIRSLPDDVWKTSDSWYELVELCYRYKLHYHSLYRYSDKSSNRKGR